MKVNGGVWYFDDKTGFVCLEMPSFHSTINQAVIQASRCNTNGKVSL